MASICMYVCMYVRFCVCVHAHAHIYVCGTCVGGVCVHTHIPASYSLKNNSTTENSTHAAALTSTFQQKAHLLSSTSRCTSGKPPLT